MAKCLVTWETWWHKLVKSAQSWSNVQSAETAGTLWFNFWRALILQTKWNNKMPLWISQIRLMRSCSYGLRNHVVLSVDTMVLEEYTSSICKVDISRITEESVHTGKLHAAWLFKPIKGPGDEECSLVWATEQGKLNLPFSGATLSEIWMWEDSLFTCLEEYCHQRRKKKCENCPYQGQCWQETGKGKEP